MRTPGALLEFEKVSSESYNISSDILSIDLDEVVNEVSDSCDMIMDNGSGLYNQSITLGDSVKLWIKTNYNTSYVHKWTGVITEKRIDRESPECSQLTLTAFDWMSHKIKTQNVYKSFTNHPIAVDESVDNVSQGFINRLLHDFVPNASRIGITNVSQRVNAYLVGDNLITPIQEAAEYAGAVFRGDKNKNFIFEKRSNKSAVITLNASDVQDLSVIPAWDNLANIVRVNGGVNEAIEIQQTDASAWHRVTNTSRFETKIFTRKSELSKVEIYTDRTSQDNIIVRLQADKGNAPVNRSSVAADITNKNLAVNFLAKGGYTTFLLPHHILGAGNNFWLIIEANNESGQQVATNVNGSLTFKAYYPYPTIVERKNQASIDKYGESKKSVDRPDVRTRKEATTIANRILEVTKAPNYEVSYTLRNDSYMDIEVGNMVRAIFPQENVSENLILNSKRTIWDAEEANILVTHTLVDIRRLMTLDDIIKDVKESLGYVGKSLLNIGAETVVDEYNSYIDGGTLICNVSHDEFVVQSNFSGVYFDYWIDTDNISHTAKFDLCSYG